MKKLIRYITIAAIFAVIFTGDAILFLKMDEKTIIRFEQEMTEYMGSKVSATYYGKESLYGEPVIIWSYGDGQELLASIEPKSQYRYAESINHTKIQSSDIGDRALEDFKRNRTITIAIAIIGLIAFVVSIVKSLD